MSGEWIATVCYMCYSHCGVKVRLEDGRIVDIKGDDNNPHSLGKLCPKGKAAIMGVYDPYRVKHPLIRTNPEKGIGVDPKWREISWDDALDIVVKKVKQAREQDPRKVVLAGLEFGFSFFQAAFLSALGSPNWVRSPGYFCGNVLHMVDYLMGASFYLEPDYELCKYCLMVGSEEGFMVDKNANRMTQKVAEARARGMKVVVVNPICSHAAAKADEWVPIRPGTDGYFALALLNILLNELGVYDVSFLKRFTNGPYLVGPDGQYVRDPVSGKPLVWDSSQAKALAYNEVDSQAMALEGKYTAQGLPACTAFELLKTHVQKYTPEGAERVTTIRAETTRRLGHELAEAASIGSTIVLNGQRLPLRPVSLQWAKGPECHRHGGHTGLALQLVSVVLGAMDVPGGMLGNKTVGPNWMPREGPDGMLMPATAQTHLSLPFPGSEPKSPECLDLRELFPVAAQTCTLFETGVLESEKYRLPYQPEVILHINSNLMMASSNPRDLARAFCKIPFMVSFAIYLDETVELADVVLPDTQFLERFCPFPNWRTVGMVVGQTPWYWPIAQPVVAPVGQARPWAQVLLEIAQSAGFGPELNVVFNTMLELKEPYRLEPEGRYNLEEIADAWAKNWFGPERDISWFKQHGVITFPKKVEEAYPRIFFPGRIPVYLEHFPRIGRKLKQVTEEMGLSWDVSDYQPLPDWRPCEAYEQTEGPHDLFAVNYKLPFHTISVTPQNPWLNELSEHHPYAYKIILNADTGREKGIRDGDLISVESPYGQVQGSAKLSQGVHPEVVAIAGAFGHWAAGMPVARNKGVHFNSLLSARLNRIDMLSASIDACVKVKLIKQT